MPKKSKFKFPTEALEDARLVAPSHVEALVVLLNQNGAKIHPSLDFEQAARERIRVVVETAASGTLQYQKIVEDPAEWARARRVPAPGPHCREALGSFMLRMAALFREFVPDAPEPYLNGASQQAVGPILDFIGVAVSVLGYQSSPNALLRQYQRARKRQAQSKR